MSVVSLLRRHIRNLNLCLHLSLTTLTGIRRGLSSCWSNAPAGGRLAAVAGGLWRAVRYEASMSINPDEHFAFDGVIGGQRRGRLTRAQRRHHRMLADLRRRHVGVLLAALGDTAQQVQANLTRHWLRSDCEHLPWLEDYLQSRLAHRDPAALRNFLVFDRVCLIGGTWVALPAAVRRYLPAAGAHERKLEGACHLPRRGPRILPGVTGVQLPPTGIRRCHCCTPSTW